MPGSKSSHSSDSDSDHDKKQRKTIQPDEPAPVATTQPTVPVQPPPYPSGGPAPYPAGAPAPYPAGAPAPYPAHFQQPIMEQPNMGIPMQPMYSNHMGGPGLPHAAPQQQIMQAPAQIPVGCPPGLEYLTMVDQLLVKQKVELFELLTGWETNNKYDILNSMGQQVYYAAEDNDCCTRNYCGPIRPFDMRIFDNAKNEVMHLFRPLKCTGCCWPCCLQELEVMSPPGTPIGYIVEEWSFLVPKFRIENANRQTVLRLTGPICKISCCNDVEFPVLSADGTKVVGKISKQWTGILKEAYTDADNFGIQFPMDLDVQTKATLLGALFLIDFLYFETQNHNNR
ncbi:phospholipid scramblase 2-like [Paramacrobiotus metropolitanus]|uniref:phospholipid scramblase 2-like n=1 Tax=Paramacrobiotus metropolitanus TaxID=2943436 RepID=UPI00244570C2|nr:phospholipid scramblase 2-like [Paramacrobiotus metropolitanus]